MTWEEFAYIFYSFSSNGWISNPGTPECQACVSALSFTHRPCTYSLHVLDKFTDNRKEQDATRVTPVKGHW